VLDLFFKHEKHTGNHHDQESGSRSTRVFPRLTSYSGYQCCNREARFAADGTAFTDELSERNTKFILCNPFFFAFSRTTLSRSPPNLAVQLEALTATTLLIPGIEIVRTSFRTPSPEAQGLTYTT
jgi:hypothetical protein